MKIDHVSIAGSTLKEMQDEFERLGMKTDYGGPHSNGITHMSLLGFDDGSYIELISKMKPGPSHMWDKHIDQDGGPCAWAIQVEDIASEVKRIKNLGISATGPEYYNRKRPDGMLVEWELGFIGDSPPGSTLPFLIKDKTPRDYRVAPSASVTQKDERGKATGSKLIGLSKVVLGVSNLDREIKLFRKVYGWKEPEKSKTSLEGALVTEFLDTPVALATPDTEEDDNWLRKRLKKFGDSPCAFLIGTSDIKETQRRYALLKSKLWFTHEVSWIPSDRLKGKFLGFIK